MAKDGGERRLKNRIHLEPFLAHECGPVCFFRKVHISIGLIEPTNGGRALHIVLLITRGTRIALGGIEHLKGGVGTRLRLRIKDFAAFPISGVEEIERRLERSTG